MLTFLPGNAQHLGSRQEQQDAFSFSDPADSPFLQHGGLLAVVADGMGGMQGGRAASTTAIQAFTRAYAAKAPDETIPNALQRSLREANAAVMSAAPGSGSTLVATITLGDTLFWISVGDSRAYLLHDGVLTQLTADHIFLEDLWTQVANRQMDRAGALANPDGQHLTSYLGLDQLPHVDVAMRGLPLEPGDTVLLCSDGVYKVLSEGELANAFVDRTPAAACEAVRDAVIAHAVQRQDNLTILAIRCEGAAALAPLPAEARRLSAPAGVLLAGLFAFVALGGFAAWKQLHYLPRAAPAQKKEHERPAKGTSSPRPVGTPVTRLPAPQQELQPTPNVVPDPATAGLGGNAPPPPTPPAAPAGVAPVPEPWGATTPPQYRPTPRTEP